MDGMLERMSSSQFSRWSAYYRSLSGTPKRERVIGSGKMQVRDWRNMSQDEQKKAQKQMWGLFKNYAIATGAKKRRQ